jgi:hypothetical protein
VASNPGRPVRLVLHSPRTGRLPFRFLAALVVTATVGLLAPVVSYAADQAPAAAVTTAERSAPMGVHCVGVHPVAFNAQGFISDPARDQGGHLWWRLTAHGTRVCIGTVVEWVQYNTVATKTWMVTIYTKNDPGGQVVAQLTATLRPGWYLSMFHIRKSYAGLTAVCITASDSFGKPCIQFR